MYAKFSLDKMKVQVYMSNDEINNLQAEGYLFSQNDMLAEMMGSITEMKDVTVEILKEKE